MRLAVLGASGHGKVIADTALQAGWQEISFFDDKWPTHTKNGAWPIIGNAADLLNRHEEFDGVLVGIGDNKVRMHKLRELASQGARLATLVHPHANVSPSVQLGAGSVVFAGSVVQVDCRLGTGCIINTGATIDHDCVLCDGVHISPGANLAGGVHVLDRSWIGVGAAVKQFIRIGADVIVGAGAVVVKDIPDGQTVIGVPATPVRPL